MDTSNSKTCSGTKSDLSKCRAPALPGSEFCFFHDPSKAERRKEAQAAGGRQNRMKTLDASTPDVKVENSGDAIALISRTINEVRRGQIDPRVANAVGYLSNILIRAIDQDRLESRIEKLESLLKVQTPTVDLNLTKA
jgi:hypothetical protein